MKIIAVSDLHGTLPNPEMMPAADVYCICGDILPLNIQRHYERSIVWLATEFFPWCHKLPCDRVYFVAGNHDFVFEQLMYDKHGNHRKSKEVMLMFYEKSDDKVFYLENEARVYKGVKFYGTPWCPDLANWAFYKDHDDLIKAFSKIPGDTAVLISHCPPRVEQYGVVLQPGWGYLSNYGCQELADRIAEVKPKLCLFGHVHSGDHSPKEIDGTTFCNVSLKDESYNAVYVNFHEFEI